MNTKLHCVFISNGSVHKVGTSTPCTCLGAHHREVGLLPINISFVSCLWGSLFLCIASPHASTEAEMISSMAATASLPLRLCLGMSWVPVGCCEKPPSLHYPALTSNPSINMCSCVDSNVASAAVFFTLGSQSIQSDPLLLPQPQEAAPEAGAVVTRLCVLWYQKHHMREQRVLKWAVRKWAVCKGTIPVLCQLADQFGPFEFLRLSLCAYTRCLTLCLRCNVLRPKSIPSFCYLIFTCFLWLSALLICFCWSELFFFPAVYLGSQSNFPSDICNLYPVLAEPRSILFFQHLLWSVNLSVCFGFSCLLLKGHISPFDTWVCIFHLYLMTAVRCSWVLQSRLMVFLKPRVWRRRGILVLEIWNNGTVGVVNNFKKYICEDEVLRPITFWKK